MRGENAIRNSSASIDFDLHISYFSHKSFFFVKDKLESYHNRYSAIFHILANCGDWINSIHFLPIHMPTNMHRMDKDNPIRPFSKINIIY